MEEKQETSNPNTSVELEDEHYYSTGNDAPQDSHPKTETDAKISINSGNESPQQPEGHKSS